MSRKETSTIQSPLSWSGMDNIDGFFLMWLNCGDESWVCLISADEDDEVLNAVYEANLHRLSWTRNKEQSEVNVVPNRPPSSPTPSQEKDKINEGKNSVSKHLGGSNTNMIHLTDMRNCQVVVQRCKVGYGIERGRDTREEMRTYV